MLDKVYKKAACMNGHWLPNPTATKSVKNVTVF